VSYSSTGPSGLPEALAYRETRFYQQTGEGWQRIEPDPALMGPWQTLETDHFTIRYRPVDVKAVTEAAPRLDRLYNKLRRDFGAAVAAPAPNITIEVATDSLPKGYALSFAKRTITVPSPALLFAPMEMTDGAVFYQSVVYPLANLVMTEVIDPYPQHWEYGVLRWQSVIDALILWALWEDGGPLAAGQEDVVRWLYQNARAAPVEAHQAVPEEYARLCRAYRVWRLEPWQTSIPLICQESDTNQGSPWVNPGLALRLGEVSTDFQIESAPASLPNSVSSVVTLATMIDYMAATYGRERLPDLIAALGEHAGWQTLIAAVFDVSAAEFEAGWQRYLAERY
jgi:hypothetical protein